MKRVQAGFTMIELIVVIAILGILAAVAMPKFIDMSSDAETAAIKGVAGSAGSAMAMNYAARKANANKGSAVTNCTDAATLLQGGLPTGYTVTSAAIAADDTVSCTVTKSTYSASFNGIGIS